MTYTKETPPANRRRIAGGKDEFRYSSLSEARRYRHHRCDDRGLLAPTSPIQAQPASPPPSAAELTVFAPRVVRHQEAGRPEFVGSKIEVVTTSRIASFADLDLTTQAGVNEFKRRIMYDVLAACDEMEADYPSNIYVPVPASQRCPDDTARAALSEANTVIAAAKARAR